MSKDEKQLTANEELEKLRKRNAELERENAQLRPPERIPSKNIPADLDARARAIVAGLKTKYAGTTGIENSLEVAAQYALDVWRKVAEVNLKSAAEQLTGNVEPMIEKYFRRKLFGK